VLTQGYTCHRSNGVVFCFCGERVFVTCLDSDCKYALERNRYSYHLMSRVIEDDIFGTRHKRAKGELVISTIHQPLASLQHTAFHVPLSPSSTSSSSSLIIGSGLDPAMLQDNPARRRLSTQNASSDGGRMLRPDPVTKNYTLQSDHVRRNLSHEQYTFLQGLAAQKENIATQRETEREQQGNGSQPPKINIRDYCKVPYRWVGEFMNALSVSRACFALFVACLPVRYSNPTFSAFSARC
jgi:hypothetical protein